MIFSIITIFPESFDSYFSSSILNRARKRGLIKIQFYNPRDFAADSRKTVDDKPFGGGPGMVMKAEPIIRSADKALRQRAKIEKRKTKIILLSARGRQFDAKKVRNWARKYKHLILISGRYEGIDERVKKILKAEEISTGPYILTGGEAAAMIIVDAVSRHIPGVLGKQISLEEKHGSFPVYTRPETLKWKNKKYRVPKTLLSGHHEKIEEWRNKGIIYKK
ncbi:MAG: tRNA (guanosine(37)-N1)-methyltransferase TrmD [Patescibacteria group bacterium]